MMPFAVNKVASLVVSSLIACSLLSSCHGGNGEIPLKENTEEKKDPSQFTKQVSWDMLDKVDENFPFDEYLKDEKEKWFLGREASLDSWFQFTWHKCDESFDDYSTLKAVKGITGIDVIGDMEIIGTKCDFLGINYYSTTVVEHSKGTGRFDYRPVSRLKLPKTDMFWDIHPEGLYDFLKKAHKDTDGKMPLFMTENGCAVKDIVTLEGTVEDYDRFDYVKRHLMLCRQAMDEGVNIIGYLYWTMLDNFEWVEGYAKRFGLIHVDYETLKRTPKRSYYLYRDFIKNQKED